MDNILGGTPAIQTVRDLIERVAPTEGRVLITGENGTGKELVALALHQASRRVEESFVTLNCGAVPSELIESELFGHERGSFTGAIARHTGKFEAATGGTLFLDEVGDMPQAMQVKLLRALQTGEVTRIGATTSLRVDVRVIAATNKDLLAAVKAGTFREDLYYRLAVVPIHIPPLRERAADIPLLVASFLSEAAERNSRPKPKFTNDALALLAGHTYPGNVRELQNLVERIVILTDYELLDAKHVAKHLPPNTQTNQLVAHLLSSGDAPAAPARKRKPRGTPPPHGTLARYNSPKYNCKCEACRAANAKYRREQRNKNRSDASAIAYVAPVLTEGAKVVRGTEHAVVTDIDDDSVMVQLASGDEDIWPKSEVRPSS